MPKRRLKTNNRFDLGRIGMLLAFAFLLAIATASIAQQPMIAAETPPTGTAEAPAFRAFSLLYISAEKVEHQLAKFLRVAHPDCEVIADPRGNRVLVRGDSRAFALTQQILDKLDRPPSVPATSPSVPPKLSPAELRAYTMPADGERWAEGLRRRFSDRNDVRLAVDVRTSQLLVFAPIDVHNSIGRTLSEAQRSESVAPVSDGAGRDEPFSVGRFSNEPVPVKSVPAAPVPIGSVSAAPVSAGLRPPLALESGSVATASDIVIRLENLTTDALRSRMEQLLGRPLSVVSTPGTGISRFALEAAPGARVLVEANHSSRELRLTGPSALSKNWAKVIRSLDARAERGAVTQLISTRNVPRHQIQQVAETLSTQPGVAGQWKGSNANQKQLVTMLFQQDSPDERRQANGRGNRRPGANGAEGPTDGQEGRAGIDTAVANAQEAATGLIGPVQIEFVEGLDILVIRGDERDVERVMHIIRQIEQLTKTTEPRIEILALANVESRAMATLVQEVYQQVLAARQGDVSITPLVKPNAILLIGRPENVETVIELIGKLDQPVAANQEFEVFRLKHASAVDAKPIIDEFFGVEQAATGQIGAEAGVPLGLAARVQTTADYRTNSLVVRARPRDMEEVRRLIEQLDTDKIDAVDEVRVFPLRNALATDLVPVLTDAIAGGRQNQVGGQAFGGPGGRQQTGASGQQSGQRSAMLRLMTIDATGRRKLESGVLTNVRISADARSNALVVTAPAESMELIAALIQNLDQVPSAEAQLKVFTIADGNAIALVEMLETLFGEAEAQQQGPALGGVGGGGDSLVRLRFSVDERTNSIIAAGTLPDLAVVEAVLLRLDDSDVRERKSVIYRLRNAPAIDVAEALNNWLRSEREVQQISADGVSSFQQIESEVIVVPEPVSNSLIVSTTPRYFDEVRALVEEIDQRPSMVMIQVVIAEIVLGDLDEFGVELGFQDSILFDRSLLGDLVTTQTVTNTTTAGGAVQTVQQDTIQAASITPGLLFGSDPRTSLGNSGSDISLATAGKVAAQGLSSLGLGRVNSELGFGGFVFSAGSENVNVLLRALQESRRLEVLSRPQIMAIDNQYAEVQVGQRVPIIRSSSVSAVGGQVNTVELEDVGIILRVQPRVSPDGLVVMEIEAEKSEVGPESEGIPVSVSPTGEVVRSPRINRIFARTVVHALSGQTVVLGGLITKRTEEVHRRVPLLSEIPLLGQLFRYDSVNERRSELLFIMTPRIVRNELDADLIKQVESARMNWVLCDVIQMHGPAGLRGRNDEWTDAESEAIYPTFVPGGGEGENLPTPLDQPTPLQPSTPLQYPEGTPTSLPSGHRSEENQRAAGDWSVTPASYERPVPLPPIGK